MIYVSYSAADFLFGLTFNGDALEDYKLPSGTLDIEFAGIRIEGDVVINFVGFTEPGASLSPDIELYSKSK